MKENEDSWCDAYWKLWKGYVRSVNEIHQLQIRVRELEIKLYQKITIPIKGEQQ